MADMPARLLPRVHPFWITLGIGMTYGYMIHKYEVGKKIGLIIARASDEFSRHQANLMLDEIDKRRLTLPAKVDNGSKV